MHVNELFAQARREEFLRAAARDRLAARARRARATVTALPDPATARAAAAGLVSAPRGPRPGPGGRRLPDPAVLARRVLARVSARGPRQLPRPAVRGPDQVEDDYYRCGHQPHGW